METQIVTIKKNLYPDIQVKVPSDKYNGERQYHLVSFVKSEMVIVQEQCDEDGRRDGHHYRGTKYFACRVNGDIIEVCTEEFGWEPAFKELNDEYKEYIADKALLEDSNG